MARKKRKRPEPTSAVKEEMEMTPMIDVTFLLLIFFMCTIKFKKLEGKLSAYLPKDVGVNTTPAEPKEKIEIKLTVSNPGTKYNPRWPNNPEPYDPEKHLRFVVGDDRVVNIQVGARTYTDIAEVRAKLTQLKQATPDRPVTIDPRPGIYYSDVVKVLDAVIDAEFLEVSFAGYYDRYENQG